MSHKNIAADPYVTFYFSARKSRQLKKYGFIGEVIIGGASVQFTDMILSRTKPTSGESECIITCPRNRVEKVRVKKENEEKFRKFTARIKKGNPQKQINPHHAALLLMAKFG